MSKCASCGKKFTCGCQKAKANNGAVVCKTCKATYNLKTKYSTTKYTPIRKNETIKRNERSRSVHT